MNENMGGKMIK